MNINKIAISTGFALAIGALALTFSVKAQDNFPDPVYPFGAVYLRKSNPPEKDWERDHKTAAQMGMNIFRHWFMWASIENSPGQYDWRDYDRMIEIEAREHIKVIIAEIIIGAPEWMWDKYPEARRVDAQGNEAYPTVGASSATGSAPMCLDNEEVKDQAGKFLTAMATRYRGNPAVMGYDVWNEGAVQECFCSSTQAKFREWLKAKYGTIEALEKAWHRYSLGDWSSVHPPHNTGGYPDSLDWLEFKRDDAIRLLRWRINLIRSVDKTTKITAHGAMGNIPAEIWWRQAAEVETYGYTYVSSRHSGAPWMQFAQADLVRGASRGKPFWHAEAEGSNLWMQPQVIGRPLDDGRSLDAKDVRLFSLIDMSAGTTGILFTRWRPLLDGPLFGAFGPMGMDGSITPQAEMGSTLARWANSHPDLWKSHPVKGDVGIVYLAEANDFNTVQSGGETPSNGRAAMRGGVDSAAGAYVQSLQGAYQAFFDNNIQADYVSINDIGEYPMIYVAFPEMLKKATADKLRDYVAKGGKLVSEGCPGYFGDGGTAGTIQPNLGLDQLFGATQTYVQFTPDILGGLTLTVNGKQIGGAFFLQEYKLSGGVEKGHYANGHIAVVENSSGQGKTLLIGTFPGGSYYRTHAPGTREFFAGLLKWAGIEPKVQSSDPEVKARLQTGAGGTYLYVVNPSRTPRTVTISLPSQYKQATELWQQGVTSASISEKTLTATVQDRDAAVLQLR